jgi:hypothetical protein
LFVPLRPLQLRGILKETKLVQLVLIGKEVWKNNFKKLSKKLGGMRIEIVPLRSQNDGGI